MRPFYIVFIALGLLLALVSCTVAYDSDLQSPGALLEQDDVPEIDLSEREPRSAKGDIRELRRGGGSRGGGGGRHGKGGKGGSSGFMKKKKHGKHEKKSHGRKRD